MKEMSRWRLVMVMVAALAVALFIGACGGDDDDDGGDESAGGGNDRLPPAGDPDDPL